MRDEKRTFTREAYAKAHTDYVPPGDGPATEKAEQKARETGKLHPLVDPAGYGVIRRSLPRFVQQDNGLWLLAIGLPVPLENRTDTTGSMGGNVDIAIRVLPDTYGLCSSVLPGCDLQLASGIFGDVGDRFVLCRPQFEMEAAKIVEQFTFMVPERDGGDFAEDPHYGLFGAAYLTAAYINRMGLKRYDFTVSDATARHRLDERQLKRIFGKEVFDKVLENGFQIQASDLPGTSEVVQDLLKNAHAFFLQVGDHPETTKFWTEIFGRERVVMLPRTEYLPQVQASIIGLTEGTLDLQQVDEFLRQNNLGKDDAKKVVRSVANIPIGAQAALPNFSKRPQKGDLFREKTDLWPIDPSEIASVVPNPVDGEKSGEAGPKWL